MENEVICLNCRHTFINTDGNCPKCRSANIQRIETVSPTMLLNEIANAKNVDESLTAIKRAFDIIANNAQMK